MMLFLRRTLVLKNNYELSTSKLKLFFHVARVLQLNKILNAEVSDTTTDAISTTAGYKK